MRKKPHKTGYFEKAKLFKKKKIISRKHPDGNSTNTKKCLYKFKTFPKMFIIHIFK